MDKPPNFEYRAIVIGAGVSGLQIASLLQNKDFEVVILEASDKIGGRIRSTRAFADFAIELGAEEVHGENSYHYNIAKKHGGEFVDESPLHYYIEYQNQFGQDAVLAITNPAINRVLDLNWEEICSYPDNQKDMSLKDYLLESCLPEDLHHAVDGILGREWATDLDKLSMKGIKRWNNNWTYGHNNFLLKNLSNHEVIMKEYAHVLDKVILNTPVASITYGEDEQVIVKDQRGRAFIGDIVVVTVPISQLKKGAIKFQPELPEKKKEALENVSMEPAMKMMLKFKNRPWAEDLGNVVTKGLITLAWPSSTGGKSQKNHVLTCLITGQEAGRLSKMEEKEAVKLVLADLVRVYGRKVEDDFDDFVIQDWTKEKYIEGGYSFPNVKEDETTRPTLAEPLLNKVFFAGEGVSRNFGPISGAIESSFTAYAQICAKFLEE